jgi:hypothetical protein
MSRAKLTTLKEHVSGEVLSLRKWANKRRPVRRTDSGRSGKTATASANASFRR